MPTEAEWTELRTRCTWTWTSQGGVNGYRVTGPNGKSIFLPAAGVRNNTSLYYVGSDGFYWSSSLRAGRPGFCCIVFFASNVVSSFENICYDGQSVRPVSE